MVNRREFLTRYFPALALSPVLLRYLGTASKQEVLLAQQPTPEPTRPPLLIPDLLPARETEAPPLYADGALYASDGKTVNFQYLRDLEILENAPVISIEDLQFPIGEEYRPMTQRGYFEGHKAWDITYRSMPEGNTAVKIRVPHPDAILLAAFDNIPLGLVALRLQSSGTMEVFYLNIEIDGEVKPYFITYTHLDPDSVTEAAIQAGQNQGRLPDIAGLMGQTGMTDGTHTHMQVIDLTTLYEMFSVDNPIAAYEAFTSLDNPISPEQEWDIFIDPSIIFPQLNSF